MRIDIRAIALFTAYEICDRYIERADASVAPFQSYQAIGCAALSIADSLYDTWVLSHEDYVSMSGNFFTTAELEKTILAISETLSWNLYTPGVYLHWKTWVQDASDIKSVVPLAVVIARKDRQDPSYIIEKALRPDPIPERFTLFPKLIQEKETPPAPAPLVL